MRLESLQVLINLMLSHIKKHSLMNQAVHYGKSNKSKHLIPNSDKQSIVIQIVEIV